jgi:hypothetical protein
MVGVSRESTSRLGTAILELWAAWLGSSHAPKNPPGGIIGRIERELFGTEEQPGPYQAATVAEFGAPELLAWQTSLGALRDDRGNLRLGRATITKMLRRCDSVSRGE